MISTGGARDETSSSALAVAPPSPSRGVGRKTLLSGHPCRLVASKRAAGMTMDLRERKKKKEHLLGVESCIV